MTNYITDTDTKAGTVGGTLLVVLLKIDTTQLVSTIIFAATGAIISFIASVVCKYVWEKLKN